MAYLGTFAHATTRRGAITQTGDTPARTCLVEAAWTCRSQRSIIMEQIPTEQLDRDLPVCYSLTG